MGACSGTGARGQTRTAVAFCAAACADQNVVRMDPLSIVRACATAAARRRYAVPPMGYDLHITRKENWTDDGGPTISEAEWRRVIEEDPELQLDTETSCTMSDGP